MNSAVTAAAPVKTARSGGLMPRHSSNGVAVMADADWFYVRLRLRHGNRRHFTFAALRMAVAHTYSGLARSAPVQLAQKASAHARARAANRVRAGGQVPSAALLPVPAQVPVPPHADALLHGAVPGRAGGQRAQLWLQRSVPAHASCIPQNGRGQKLWWKRPAPVRQPSSGLRSCAILQNFSAHAHLLAEHLAAVLVQLGIASLPCGLRGFRKALIAPDKALGRRNGVIQKIRQEHQDGVPPRELRITFRHWSSRYGSQAGESSRKATGGIGSCSITGTSTTSWLACAAAGISITGAKAASNSCSGSRSGAWSMALCDCITVSGSGSATIFWDKAGWIATGSGATGWSAVDPCTTGSAAGFGAICKMPGATATSAPSSLARSAARSRHVCPFADLKLYFQISRGKVGLVRTRHFNAIALLLELAGKVGCPFRIARKNASQWH